MSGRLIAIVGPSGVGKDSVMAGLAAACPQVHLARRVITREADSGGEDFDSVTPSDFARQIEGGVFALHWQAHGLSYGIPAQIDAALIKGQDVVANLSRAVLLKAQERFVRTEVILLTADREVLSDRLHARGRESKADIARRLDRADFDLPAGVRAHRVDNSGSLQDTITALAALLYPAERVRSQPASV